MMKRPGAAWCFMGCFASRHGCFHAKMVIHDLDDLGNDHPRVRKMETSIFLFGIFGLVGDLM
jgi:hypothetical protein